MANLFSEVQSYEELIKLSSKHPTLGEKCYTTQLKTRFEKGYFFFKLTLYFQDDRIYPNLWISPLKITFSDIAEECGLLKLSSEEKSFYQDEFQLFKEHINNQISYLKNEKFKTLVKQYPRDGS